MKIEDLYTINETSGCWIWKGPLSPREIKYYQRRNAEGYVVQQKIMPKPRFRCEGKEINPAQALHIQFYGGPIPRGAPRRCGNYLCVNPHHRYPDRDDITDLIDLLEDFGGPYESFEHLRETVCTEYSIADYREAFQRKPDLHRLFGDEEDETLP